MLLLKCPSILWWCNFIITFSCNKKRVENSSMPNVICFLARYSYFKSLLSSFSCRVLMSEYFIIIQMMPPKIRRPQIQKGTKWLELLFLSLAYIPAGRKSSLRQIHTFLCPKRIFWARETYDASKSWSYKDKTNHTSLKNFGPLVEEKLMIPRRFWMRIEHWDT